MGPSAPPCSKRAGRSQIVYNKRVGDLPFQSHFLQTTPPKSHRIRNTTMSYRSQYAPVPTQSSFGSTPSTHVTPGSTAAAAQAASSASWDTLRRQARNLENEIESKLVAYSKLGSQAAGGSGGVVYSGSTSSGYGVSGGNAGGAAWHSAQVAEMEVDELLKKVNGLTSLMVKVDLTLI